MYYSNSALWIILYVFMPEVRPETQFSPQMDNEIVFFFFIAQTVLSWMFVYERLCVPVCVCVYLYRLRVVEMVTEVHEDLRHPVWDIVGARKDARTEAEHSTMAPH